MTLTANVRDILDLPKWRHEGPLLAANAAGQSLAWDMRNGETGCPFLYNLRSATAFDCYDPTTGDWLPLASPALAGTFGAGAAAIFHPSQGPRGTIAAGASATSLPLTTALPAAVALNQLANRGDGVGYRVKVSDNAAGGTGKTEYRTIIGNTAGTTPTLILDSGLSFSPVNGAAYEIRSGRVFLLSAGTLAAGVWKYYDIATNSYSAALATTNLPATIGTDSAMMALSESYVSNDRSSGEGFVSGGATYDGGNKNCIALTAVTGTTCTGAGMPADLQANEYRNFQVHVVEDTVNPTAVNQRRRISSHTGGATGVFTVPAWTVNPSTSAKIVVENDDDKILRRGDGTTAVYTYNIAANTWDTTTFGAAGGGAAAGTVLEQAFGITRDTTLNARHSHIYSIRGGSSATIDVLDIAGGATGVWSNDIAYGKKAQTFTTGTCGAYDPVTLGGRFLHLNINGTQRMARFDLRNRILDAGTYMRFPGGTAVVGGRMATSAVIDGATKVNNLYAVAASTANMLSLLTPR